MHHPLKYVRRDVVENCAYMFERFGYWVFYYVAG